MAELAAVPAAMRGLRGLVRTGTALAAVLAIGGCGASRGDASAPGQIPQLSWQMPAGNVNPAPFMARLQTIVSSAPGPVTIIQLGDSHTAGDKFSGRLRELFQNRYGGAGRGEMGAGSPFGFFEPSLVAVVQTDGWRIENSRSGAAIGPFSISGYTVIGDSPTDSMVLQSTEPAGFEVIEIGAFEHPGGGSLEILVDGRQVGVMRTNANRNRLVRFSQQVLRGSRQLVLRPIGDGEVWLSSWDTYRNTRGVVLESHGIVGATVGISNRWDRDAYLSELTAADPAMVILAYGTNEGFNDDLEPEEYRAEFSAQLSQIEAAAPNASIVIVGPPDAARLPANCRSDDVESITFPCGPLSQSDRANYRALFGDNAQGAACRWHQPPNLDMVRAIQAQVANQRGYYFWDWSRAMGGACSVHEWAQREPPLARRDHIHLTDEGYRLSADALFRDLTGSGAVASVPRGDQPGRGLDDTGLRDALDGMMELSPP
ncbi:MAG: GDSL-type esterase/lipase family protein [Alphaproteobacteria bacterium]